MLTNVVVYFIKFHLVVLDGVHVTAVVEKGDRSVDGTPCILINSA